MWRFCFMNDSYNELLVRKETDVIQKVLRVVCVIPTAICALMGFGLANIIILILAIGFGVLDYFIYQWTDVEFEYLYLDKEISIDKIFAKSRRKKVCTIDVHKIEMLAPANSYHLDSFKNSDRKTTDFSAGKDVDDQKLYHMYYEGNQKYLLNLTEDFAKVLKGIEPRKVFTD